MAKRYIQQLQMRGDYRLGLVSLAFALHLGDSLINKRINFLTDRSGGFDLRRVWNGRCHMKRYDQAALFNILIQIFQVIGRQLIYHWEQRFSVDHFGPQISLYVVNHLAKVEPQLIIAQANSFCYRFRRSNRLPRDS